MKAMKKLLMFVCAVMLSFMLMPAQAEAGTGDQSGKVIVSGTQLMPGNYYKTNSDGSVSSGDSSDYNIYLKYEYNTDLLSTETYKYVLTLKDATINGAILDGFTELEDSYGSTHSVTGIAGIYYYKTVDMESVEIPLEIRLIGRNTIHVDFENPGTVSGNSISMLSSRIAGSSSCSTNAGIVSNENIYLGPGMEDLSNIQLDINVNIPNLSNIDISGISTFGNIEIDSIDLNLNLNSSSQMSNVGGNVQGLESDKDININNSDVNVNTSGVSSEVNNNAIAANGNIDIKDSNVTATSGNTSGTVNSDLSSGLTSGITTNGELNVKNSTVNSTGGNAQSGVSYGSSANGDINVDGSTLNGAGGIAGYSSMGVCSNQDLNLKNSSNMSGTSGNAGGNSYGSASLGATKIEDSNVNCIAGSSLQGQSVGLISGKETQINNSKVNASSGESGTGAAGILATGFLNVSGNSEVNGVGKTATNGKSTGVATLDKLILSDDAIVNGQAGNSLNGDSYGGASAKDMEMKDSASATFTGGNATGGNSYGYGSNGNVSLNNNSKLYATGGIGDNSFGLGCDLKFIMNDNSTFHGKGGDAANGNSFASASKDDTIIQQNAAYEGIAGNAINGMSVGMGSEKNIYIYGLLIKAKGDTASMGALGTVFNSGENSSYEEDSKGGVISPLGEIAFVSDTGEIIPTYELSEELIEEAKEELKALIGDSYGHHRMKFAADLRKELTSATKIKIVIDGLSSADSAIILHKGADGWEVIPNDTFEDYLTGKFKNLSPVVVFVNHDGNLEAAENAASASVIPSGTTKPAPTGDSANIAFYGSLTIAALAVVLFLRKKYN